MAATATAPGAGPQGLEQQADGFAAAAGGGLAAEQSEAAAAGGGPSAIPPSDTRARVRSRMERVGSDNSPAALQEKVLKRLVPPPGVHQWEYAEEGHIDVIYRAESKARPGCDIRSPRFFMDRRLRQYTSGGSTLLSPQTCSSNRSDDGMGGNEDSPEQSRYLGRESKYPLDGTPAECGFVHVESKLLGKWRATSICANDITSSILYTGGLVIGRAGFLAPLSFAVVMLVLWGFRPVYEEVVTALPMNGGTYSAMINIALKKYATIAATLSIISYIATVVTSGASAMGYLSVLWSGLNVEAASIVVFVLFALLMLLGVKESSMVSLVIFGVHVATMSIVLLCSLTFAFSNGWAYMRPNYEAQLPYPVFSALVFGYAQAMLGITGFETSANFVEEQKKGVFRKTLLNMWAIAGFFNITICTMAFATIPVEVMYKAPGVVADNVANQLMSTIATQIAGSIGGMWLTNLVVVDGVLVLCGAVFTGYVGVTGLVVRMVDDDCLPAVLNSLLPRTGANWPVPLLFCAINISLYAVTGGSVEEIGGVYVVAFLSVMTMFALSCLVMKHTRSGLHRDVRADWRIVLALIGMCFVALVGNLIMNPTILGYFAIYFLSFLLVIIGVYARTFLLEIVVNLLYERAQTSRRAAQLRDYLIDWLHSVQAQPIVFFAKHLGNKRDLNRAIRYFKINELTRYVVLVHVFSDVQRTAPDDLTLTLSMLVQMYPTIRIDVLLVEGTFGPGLVRQVEALLGVSPKRMTIASPSPQLK